MDISYLSIPDSTDWLTTSLACVAPVESALRCQVCKDFFDNPVITSCSHTFCSLCIRRCLSTEGKCPACRAPDQELKLRRNCAVQELVDCFQAAREAILDLARRDSNVEPTSPRKNGSDDAHAPKADIPQRGSHVSARDIEADMDVQLDNIGFPAAKKRRINPPTPSLITISGGQSRRSSRVLGRMNDAQHGASAIQTVVVENSEDEDFIPEDGLVACPICNRRMKNEEVFGHLDSCRGCQETTKVVQSKGALQSWNPPLPHNTAASSLDTKRPERLPGLNYSILKDNTLRKKLRELGIPDWGSRTLLQRRHTEWINLWNANCDAKEPKPKKELLRELNVWERSQGGVAQTHGPQNGTTASVMRKDFDTTAWSISHCDDFKKLIESARKKVGTSKECIPSQTDLEDEGERSGPDMLNDLNDINKVNATEEQDNEGREGTLISRRPGSAVDQIDNSVAQKQSSNQGEELEAPVLETL